MRHCHAHSQNKGLSKYQRTASRLQTGLSPTRDKQAGVGWGIGTQRQKGAITAPEWHPLPNCKQASLLTKSSWDWMVDICQEGRSQRLSSQKRHVAHLRRCTRCTPRKPSVRNGGGDKTHSPPGGYCACQAPGHLSCLDLGRAQNTGPTESAPLRATRVPEPEQLRLGKCIQPRASLRQFPKEQPRA